MENKKADKENDKEYMEKLLESSQKYFIKAAKDKEIAKRIKKIANY